MVKEGHWPGPKVSVLIEYIKRPNPFSIAGRNKAAEIMSQFVFILSAAERIKVQVGEG